MRRSPRAECMQRAQRWINAGKVLGTTAAAALPRRWQAAACQQACCSGRLGPAHSHNARVALRSALHKGGVPAVPLVPPRVLHCLTSPGVLHVCVCGGCGVGDGGVRVCVCVHVCVCECCGWRWGGRWGVGRGMLVWRRGTRRHDHLCKHL